MKPREARTMLVVRLSSLGDILLTQPVLTQASREGWHVDLLVRPAYQLMAEMLPGPIRVISRPEALRPEYHAVLDLHASLRAGRMLRHTASRVLVRYDKRSLARRLLVRPGGRKVFWNAWSGLRPEESVLAWYAEAGCRAGLRPAAGWPEVRVPELALAEARALLEQAGVPSQAKVALLAPGAAWPSKRWPAEHYGRAAVLLREQGLFPVLVGAADDVPLCRAILAMIGAPGESLAGQTSLPVLAGLFQSASVAITNDSGPLHLGLAAGCPVVALFGPTVPEFGFAPLGHPRAAVLSQDLKCRPCALHGGRACPLGHLNCLAWITPEAAVQAAMTLMR